MKKRISHLGVLLAAVCFCGLLGAQTEMGISFTGQANIPYPHKLAAVENDTLALYNYEVDGHTISHTRFTVSPDGAVSSPQTILSYDADPAWGEISVYNSIFTYKNSKLLAAYLTPAKLIVTRGGQAGTEVHLFDITGDSGVYSHVYLASDTLGFLCDQTQSQARIYRLDLATDSLVLLQEVGADIVMEPYYIWSFADDYFLFTSSCDSGLPDLLFQGTILIHTYPDHWIQGWYGYFGGYANRVCGQYYMLRVDDGLEKSRGILFTALAYVAENQIQLIDLEPYGGNYYTLGPSVAHSDSTFSCIESLTHNEGYILESVFNNYRIADGEMVYDPVFPYLGDYPNPASLFGMGQDYMVAQSLNYGISRIFILADYTDESIREYEFTFATEEHLDLYHSSEYIWMVRHYPYLDRVYLLRLEELSPVDDELMPVAELQARISPNPFKGSCEICFSGKSPSSVRIYNVRGQLVRELSGDGGDTFVWDSLDDKGRRAVSGVYFLQAEVGGKTLRKKLVLMR